MRCSQQSQIILRVLIVICIRLYELYRHRCRCAFFICSCSCCTMLFCSCCVVVIVCWIVVYIPSPVSISTSLMDRTLFVRSFGLCVWQKNGTREGQCALCQHNRCGYARSLCMFKTAMYARVLNIHRNTIRNNVPTGTHILADRESGQSHITTCVRFPVMPWVVGLNVFGKKGMRLRTTDRLHTDGWRADFVLQNRTLQHQRDRLLDSNTTKRGRMIN